MTPEWIELFRTATASTQPLVMSLATVDSEGRPRVRSVVCRSIADDGSLWFASDARSGKNTQLRTGPSNGAVEVVAWLPVTREQFRLSGVARVIPSGAEESRQMWEEINPESRAMYFWPPPGEARTPDDSAFIRTSDAPLPPPTFEVIVLQPTSVEHLSLAMHPHQRRRWTMERNWGCEELNP